MLFEKHNKRKKDDPLSSLYQLDADRHISPHIELHALVKTLDDVEIIGALEEKLKEMIMVDEATGMQTLNKVEHVIHKIRRDQTKRANNEWRLKFSTALDLLY